MHYLPMESLHYLYTERLPTALFRIYWPPINLSTHYGKPIGTIKKDVLPAVVGEFGAPPPMIPVKVSYHPANSEAPIEKTPSGSVRSRNGSSLWFASSTFSVLRMELGNSTIEGTVTLQFEETDTVYTEPFRRASPLAYLDVMLNVDQISQISFADTLSNSAGKATLKSVSISIIDKPQIAKAEIAEVIAPEGNYAG